ncbi:beta-ketoacyl synthase N-terminal-like domain-containing protein [Actinopolyspora mortivallis]|uniref:Beta keto-acyl synthase n=1 Tax=Actinopolyspora mortivallis TaxID=33906 RepID=A0A2T0GWV0_ACTMO|nr:beta-ketoacyl synthase N-terminal-like domain-containing protein [Actinopolyspora mortivallis]PRW63503.1 beta keto-acyl synthase [Actinopolyspora mortivallis]
MSFEPVAIVGQGCVLPDATDPTALWENVREGRISLSPVPDDRWRVPKSSVLAPPDSPEAIDRVRTDIGGYVHGVDGLTDPTGLTLSPEELSPLDPVVHWVVHSARQALRGINTPELLARGGLISGNLSFPTSGLTRFAEGVWLHQQDRPFPGTLSTGFDNSTDPRNRFSSGMPVSVAAEVLGLRAGGFALDAACASSLYAIKLACDRLHDRSLDLVVAGGVSCADSLCIHLGFTALSALSPTGESRPFHRNANGLVPAEGAAFVALLRLSDALRMDLPVLGIVRGIGLSNNGRNTGLLEPGEKGQEHAMHQAYRQAEIPPESVTLLECHATGTPTGDSAEIRSASRVFADSTDLPVGSLKANIGHSLTTAGAAGLIKVLGAFTERILPLSPSAEDPVEPPRGSPVRVLQRNEEWSKHRRAGISAFGFGGCNAHLILDACPTSTDTTVAPSSPAPNATVAIVGVSVHTGSHSNTRDFRQALFTGTASAQAAEYYPVGLTGLRFPPHDLEQAHAQQTFLLEAAREAAEQSRLPSASTAVVAGMGCDPESARYATRVRAGALVDGADTGDPTDQGAAVREAFSPPLRPAGVLGTMPNVVANRLNVQLDLHGPSLTISAEEASGLVALESAARSLGAREIDAALVAAVDLSHEPVHTTAITALAPGTVPGDAAVVLILKRFEDARNEGDRVYAILDQESGSTENASLLVGDRPGDVEGTTAHFDPGSCFGRAHAASGLLSAAIATLALRHRAIPRHGAAADPWLGEHVATVNSSTVTGQHNRLRLRGPDRSRDTAAFTAHPSPLISVFSGNDRDSAQRALESGQESSEGPARLVIISQAGEDRTDQARRWLAEGGPRPWGIAFRERPVQGEVAFVFTNGAASYSGMGRELLLAFPDLLQHTEQQVGALTELTGWAYGQSESSVAGSLEALWSAAVLAHVHSGITRKLLGLRPNAVLGYSSGESAACIALGLWTNPRAVSEHIRSSQLFRNEILGEYRAVRQVWNRSGITGSAWKNYAVWCSPQILEEAVTSEPAAHLIAINSPTMCVLGGEAEACRRVLRNLDQYAAVPLDYDMAAHAPELSEVRDQWWRAHHWDTVAAPGLRCYSCGSTEPYTPTSDAIAQALTTQGTGPIDFPATVERAWSDGVRVFIEHGPKSTCTGWIRQTLGERDFLAVALDREDRDGTRQLADSTAELVAAGLEVDSHQLFERLGDTEQAPEKGKVISLRAHPAPVLLPEPFPPAVVMPTAPRLEPTTDAYSLPHGISGGNGSATTLTRLIQDQYQRAAAVHRAFLNEQATVHQRFLDGAAHASALHNQFDSPHKTTSSASTRFPDNSRARPASSSRRKPSDPAEHRVREAPHPQREPLFDREQLEYLSWGRVSALFGPQFLPQDEYPYQTRMPQPPMLLADRVLDIDAEPASLGTGSVSTETDVRTDSWYLDHTGHMPAGLLVEAGQADLLLISWLGIDLRTRGERVYRLLGCELTFHRRLPVPGETLRFDIHIDGHGEHDGIRLFFFRSDCWSGQERQLSVREGQAGFFTHEELEQAPGLMWDAVDEAPAPGSIAPPLVRCRDSHFDFEAVRAFAEGRPADCFGHGWERTRAHVRTPRVGDGKMLLLERVAEFDPGGGPWRGGYLRAETTIEPDEWFFAGHFKNDPCMPGTLMFEGCLQALSFYLSACGFTVSRDGWRFEPVPEQPYRLRCRGQVSPNNRKLSYEVFVAELSDGPYPTVFADVLCSVDGTKAFHGRRLGLRLVPDWPLSHWRHLEQPRVQETGQLVPLAELGGLRGHDETRAATVDGFRFGYAAMLAAAWGAPSEAFGPLYSGYDDGRTIPRLPGPPYHFISRVSEINASMGELREGSSIDAEYDVPDQAWYFEQNDTPTMPIAVLMEVALQPCGWLASYLGSVRCTVTEPVFRNLDGTATLHDEVLPTAETIRTHVEFLKLTGFGDTLIETFAIHCYADERLVLEGRTVFGFFPPESFENQVGIPDTEKPPGLDDPNNRDIDLTVHRNQRGEGPRLPGPMLGMLHRVTGFWSASEEGDSDRIRAEQRLRGDEWYFRAHFFQDPVQPGSLGVQAMTELLQYYVILQGVGTDLPDPRFEPIALGSEFTWTYRGQVVPTNRSVVIEAEIRNSGRDERGHHVRGRAWLWADGTCLYRADLGIRVVPGTSPTRRYRRFSSEDRSARITTRDGTPGDEHRPPKE